MTGHTLKGGHRQHVQLQGYRCREGRKLGLTEVGLPPGQEKNGREKIHENCIDHGISC